jgi:alpha-beta hydrolase superfamily lysophospholipase
MDSDALFGRDTHHGLRAIAGHLLVAHLGPHSVELYRIIPGQGVMDQPCPAPYLTAMTMKPVITGRRALLAGLALAGCAEARAPMGPVVTRPAVLDDALVMADGLRLPLHAWRPEGPPRAVMLALHGMNEYGRSFAEDAAPWFTGAGVALYAYDQRGFGGAAPRGVWPGHETLAQDAITAAGLMRARHPGLPVFMMGESMGGAVLVLAGSKAPMADGLVLSAPALRGRASLAWQARLMLDTMNALTPGLALSSSAPLFRPTDNLDAWRRWSGDPQVLKQTRVDAVAGLVDLMDAATAALPRFTAPALVLYGAKDELVPPKPIRAALAQLPRGAAQRLAFYPEGHHMLLRDLGGAAVAGDILAWMADRDAPLPSGADQAAAAWLGLV